MQNVKANILINWMYPPSTTVPPPGKSRDEYLVQAEIFGLRDRKFLF